MTERSAALLALALSAALFTPALADPFASAPMQIAQGESELDFWNGIKDSKKAEDYQAYLDKYPDGNFADLAKLRVKKYAPAPAPAATPAPAEPAVDPQQADIAYWNSIKASTKAEDYKAYLEKYPNGEFVDLAKLRVEKYGAPAPAQAPTEPPAAPEPKAAEPAAVEPAPAQPPAAAPAPAQAPTFEAKDATVYAKNGGQVRSEPDSKAALVTKLKTNTEVHATGLSSDGKWWRVEVAGQSGYMHRTVVSAQPVVLAPSSQKSAPEAAAAPTGPDEEVCPAASQVAANDRVAACERLVVKAGDDTAKLTALGNLAVSLSMARRYDEAIRKYEQAAALAPRDATIYYDIGLVRLDQRRFKEAYSAFEKAATIDNKNPDIVFQRGVAVMGFGDVEKARLEVKRALLTKDDAGYYEKLGEIEIARGDLDSAKTALERGRKADSSRQSLILAAVNYFTGDLDQAGAQATASLGAPTAPLWSALAKKAKGDAAGAAAALEAGRSAAGDAWPGPVFDALSGGLSLAQARAAAKSKDANTQFEQLCALNFFAGEWAYLAGDKDAARAALQAALDTRAYWTLEFAAAKARLANMGG
ncbi:tetratricopeptide repeat protein [Dongia sedimenti]|uniref:Tetratricopeptide repeat protein n=1 Tax=Dongia sedimenti TaxID=3064282 RepID=A0ABU0YLG3_9PROT|nr:tetratricopeptide repeat protein [Rhodospirillaceae bacterium R-7]